jgi:hydrogenase small subunit
MPVTTPEAIPFRRSTKSNPDIDEVHILWIPDFLGCDGDSVALTAASEPAIEDVVLGGIPGLPTVHVHVKALAYEVGEELMEIFRQAERGEIENFILVIEGSIPNEHLSGEGYFAAMGTDQETGQPIASTHWIDVLADKALAVVAAGTCATWGGVHAMQNNPTGAMGLRDYLGWDWKSKIGLPIINIPGCPIQQDNFMDALTHLLRFLAGVAPVPPLDEYGRPTWLFGFTVHEGCDRAAFYEVGDFAKEYGSMKCLVKLGCWGPVVNCNVPKRGWIGGIGGCPNVGGICIACTMPGFPDKIMPHMEQPPGSVLSSNFIKPYGITMRNLRKITNHTIGQEPKWRHNRPELTTGYNPSAPGRQ